MKLTFLGTGAADTSPLIATQYADHLDKTLRRCSSLLIDGHLMIDCGPHALHAMELMGISPRPITDLFITHLHGDHYRPDQVRMLAAMTDAPLRVWHHGQADLSEELPGITCIPLPMGAEQNVSDGITITALPANHTAYPVHYLLRLGEKSLFYGCDGAWMLNQTYYHLRNTHLTACILDATVGDYEDDWRAGEHNSQPMLRLLVQALRKWGTIDPQTAVILSHLATTLHPSHEEFEQVAKKDGMILAYDGMEQVL